ncbi:ulp1 protease family protein [Colletotrichum tofieldiae]|nr:ulp1 protease family protein [Colletotrichum tofieldiae]
MALDQSLQRLNSLSEHFDNNLLSRRWTQLQQDFVTERPEADFLQWALLNVHRKILNLAVDESFTEDVASLRSDIRRRWKSVCSSLDCSIGVLVMLFGTDIAASRPCLDAFVSLTRKCPATTLCDLFDTFQRTPTLHEKYRYLLAPYLRLQRAVNFSPARIQNPNNENPVVNPQSLGSNQPVDLRLRDDDASVDADASADVSADAALVPLPTLTAN